MFEALSVYLTLNLLRLPPSSALAASVIFFIADTLKILLLLLVITHLMSLLRFYLPINKLRDFLVKNKLYGFDYFFAALFGALTPFCSCSSIPLFLGFLQAGIPLGVTLTFLITSPLVNEAALALFVGVFGWRVTIIYALSSMAIGMAGGYILSKLNLEKYAADYAKNLKNQTQSPSEKKLPLKEVLVQASKEAFGIIKKIILYVLAGVALGAAIHGFVPTGYFAQYITKDNLLAVPLAVIIGVPLYANATGVIPIIQALVDKGIPLGTALAMMMAIVGLSLPEALILKKVMKLPLLLAFFGTVTIGIILLGYFFNFIFID